MKNKFNICSLVIFALSGTLPVFAQQTPGADATTPRYREESKNERYHLGNLDRADKLIGREIKDTQDQKIGKVKDMAIDLQNGRLVEVIVGVGGVLGVDEKFVAVPPEQFTYDPAAKTLTVNVDKAKFEEAPSFKLSEWKNEQPDVTQVYQYFGTKPYFTSEDLTDRNKNTVKRLGEVERADKLIGTTVHNMQNESLGKIHDLIVDLRDGRVAEVILASGGFLGMGDEYSAVPPQSFRRGTETGTVVLDTAKDALSNAPHFKSSEWPDFNDSQQVIAVYRAYNVEPYFITTPTDNTAQNARDRSGNTLTPFNQGSSEADMEMTRQIRKQILADDTLSVNAHNVKVITLNGKVTLRGTVNTQEEKRKIEDIANKAATPGNVDDQIQVENRTSSAQ